MTTITLNTTPQQEKLITDYMEQHPDAQTGFLALILEEIENQADLKALRQAQAEDDGYRISFEDIVKKYAHEL